MSSKETIPTTRSGAPKFFNFEGEASGTLNLFSTTSSCGEGPFHIPDTNRYRRSSDGGLETVDSNQSSASKKPKIGSSASMSALKTTLGKQGLKTKKAKKSSTKSSANVSQRSETSSTSSYMNSFRKRMNMKQQSTAHSRKASRG
mmetsp:Transcript_52015/g.59407  ORF Transcript_52015/g.59407 Transcript_52015/m.59407 type:complete len:145 (+) Transcript_52015:1-435(+)